MMTETFASVTGNFKGDWAAPITTEQCQRQFLSLSFRTTVVVTSGRKKPL